jgi:transcriptional regulator of arginine metabolism
MTKRFRQGQILKLIQSRKILTQDELAHALKEAGVEATQVTLSRDIRELGLAKTADGYRRIGREQPRIEFSLLAAEFLEDVRCAQNQIVLRTSPGHANSVAVALDGERWPEVVGTIAGDDTILVICPDSPTALAVQSKIKLRAFAERGTS